jgi:hypothetical protein
MNAFGVVYNLYINIKLYLELMCILFKWLWKVILYVVEIILTTNECTIVRMVFELNLI